MAWRIDEQVQRGELDNRARGRVTGRIWLLGKAEPVELDLEGNPWRDLAGHRFEFVNPSPQPGDLDSFNSLQQGTAGDITAARKVRVPDCSMEELRRHTDGETPYPWHCANSFYFEWFSDANGRVVIESVNFQLKVDPEPAWTMTEEEEEAQQRRSGEAILRFMQRLGGAVAPEDLSDAEDDDAAQSGIEAAADADDARMNLLLDRVDARLKREGRAHEDWDELYREERERLRRDRGEPEPEPLTPEQEAEREAWIEEMNAAGQEALEQAEADKWKDTGERRQHPLVERCGELSFELHRSVEEAGWLKDGDHEEHPLREILSGVMIAGPKLAGALDSAFADEEWPPEPLFAGNVLVRLKKGRRYLEDALRGVECAEAERIATPEWLAHARREIDGLLTEVIGLIAEVRASLR